MHMNTIGKIAIAATAGLAVGSVLGILFAPDKGTATRKKIADSSNRLTDVVKDKLSSLRVNIKNKAEELKKMEGELS